MTNQIVPIKNETDLNVWINKISTNLKSYSENADKKFFKSAMLAIIENNDLMQALKTPSGQMSVYNSLKYAASTGLSLNPQEGKAALISYNSKAGTVVNLSLIHI